MSRHELLGLRPHHKVVVGWDHPMLTYFVHVHDTTKEGDENPVIWLGGRPRQLYDIDALRNAIRPYADLSQDLAVALYADRDEGR